MSASGEAYGENSVAAYTEQPPSKVRHCELSEEAYPNVTRHTATALVENKMHFDSNDER